MTFSVRFETVELSLFSLSHFYGFDEKDVDEGGDKRQRKRDKGG